MKAPNGIVCVLLATLAACGGGFSPNVVGHAVALSSVSPARDVGRTDARAAVRIVVQLRYNHEAELERFVSALGRAGGRRYLSPSEFLARYAPAAPQEQRVVRALRSAGFQVTKRYKNRLVVDAVAPAATVERYFSTVMHSFAQRRGLRVANVRPLKMPPALSPYVAAVEADDRIIARRGLESDDVRPMGTIPTVVKNGNFDTGKLAPWTNCGGAAAAISKEHPKGGRYDVLLGSTVQEVHGWSAICQRVTIPPSGELSAWLYEQTSEPNGKLNYQEVALLGAGGKRTILSKTSLNYSAWVHQKWDLSKYAGARETLFFGVHGTNRKKFYVAQYVDGVSLTGITTPPTPMPGLGPNNTWGPSIVSTGVAMPSLQGYTGHGQTAAIVIDATVSPADVATYVQYFKIAFTGAVSQVAVDGGGAPDAQGEASLDLETILGLAPAANIIVYNIPALDNQSIEDAYEQAVSDGLATVVNSSFGQCDTNDAAFTSMTDAIALGAAAQGLTFSASSGDSGEGCPGPSGYISGVNAPASDPHFVSVGGTQSGSSAGPTTPITNPAVWNDAVGAGGGGVSTAWTPPPYQLGIAGASTSGRNVPDIALPAVDDSLYFNGGWYQVWGTSWASPIYVAMQLEINQACAKPLWGINALYGAFAKTGYQFDFIDVTAGNNAWGGSPGYSATTGFDNASGLGIPLGNQLIIDTCGTRSADRTPRR